MQIYFPNLRTKQGAIGLFDYLIASKESENGNVIYNSDLNLENLAHLPGGTQSITESAPVTDCNLFKFLGFIVKNFEISDSQLFQDLYVLWKLKNKSNGIFVEVGVGYPTGLNNTWLLESRLNWNGVLVEPNPFFYDLITKFRKTPLEKKAIHYDNSEPMFLCILNDFQPGAGIKENLEIKVGSSNNITAEVIVESISMSDCLEKYKIPYDFDYLSYDTTGNVADIQNLQLMFNKNYFPKIITIGHNYKNHRKELNNMLKLNGYNQEFEYLSRWDDWYCHNSLKDNE